MVNTKHSAFKKPMHSANRLIHETSPYLLQHAYNPVDWYPWGDEALQKAKEENKPILISIGYSACHWCHVMERESFEDPEVAAVMNDHFINIKIDREERPDLDHIYMDAVQVMTGSGGWPLNVFLTPDAKPFYGGTYFPPKPMHNRASWADVLYGVYNAFTERKQQVKDQAEGLTAHLLKTGNFDAPAHPTSALFDASNKELIFENLMKSADTLDGGFGRAPKFPQAFTIQYLLKYYYLTKNETALKQACLSLDKMIDGGIYDQLGGGFARYATDNKWLVPHFEKMLYDNALLIATLCEAYQLTHDKRYAQTIDETMAFIEREMMSEEFGFYSALDADSEGEEGKFYVWSKDEIDTVLGQDSSLFCNYYNVTEGGNWEEKNILHVTVLADDFCAAMQLEKDLFLQTLEQCKRKLMAVRDKRPRPLLDDKMLLGWNALMNTACSKAYIATGNEHYRSLATQNMAFINKRFKTEGVFYHTYKNDKAKYPAFLDDYAYLIQALIQMQEITGDAVYLNQAKDLTVHVLNRFADTESGLFFFTDKDQQDVIIRKKEIYDSAVPSGNSVMAGNLLYLSHVFDENSWKERANEMVGTLLELIVRYPASFGVWANIWLTMAVGMREIVITGQKINDILFDILHTFIPFRILQSSPVPLDNFPLLKGKRYFDPFLVYLCKNYVCAPPLNDLNAVIEAIEIQ
ncbi:MAG: thioredoxin domain-containing protein [Chitinophagaceae bacterium]